VNRQRWNWLLVAIAALFAPAAAIVLAGPMADMSDRNLVGALMVLFMVVVMAAFALGSWGAWRIYREFKSSGRLW